MDYTKNYSGSEWSKWDLHIHSNASDGEMTPEEIIEKAVEENITTIALTDHHTFKNVDKIKCIGEKNNISVISGVEIRTDKGKSSVHIIGLFPDEYNGIKLDCKYLTENVLDKLDLSESKIIAKGKSINKDFDNERAFHEGMFKCQASFEKAAQIIHNNGGLVYVHAGSKSNSIETIGDGRTIKDEAYSLESLKDELLNHIDIFDFGKYDSDEINFYIENFKKPAIVASDAHKISDIGKKYSWIKADCTFDGLKQIIYEPRLRVNNQLSEMPPEIKSDYNVIEKLIIDNPDFVNQEIPFNQNLNVIIGGRSSGKSILLGSIAKLVGDVKEIKKGNDNYNNYVSKIIDNMKLIWKDHSSNEINHTVIFIPQSYINTVASENKDFIELLNDIIKSDPIKANAYDEYNRNISLLKTEIVNNINSLFEYQYKVVELEKQANALGDINAVKAEITKLEADINKNRNKLNDKLSDKDEKEYMELKSSFDASLIEIKNNESTKNKLLELTLVKPFKDITDMFTGIPETINEKLLKELKNLENEFSSKWNEIINKEINVISKNIDNLNIKINNIENKEIYLRAEKYYSENIKIKDIINRLNIEKNKEKQLLSINGERDAYKVAIKGIKDKIFNSQDKFYDCIKVLAQKITLTKDDMIIKMNFKCSFEKLKNFSDSHFSSKSDFYKAITEFSGSIEDLNNLLKSYFEKILSGNQKLKSNTGIMQTLIDLFSNLYYDIYYEVEYQNDKISDMSEGKKAFVVLKLLLDFDEHEYPILIDQPEDDLDNRAIYDELVSYLRKKKAQRQIIIVTHNSNIAVATDAEEIIVANQNGIGNLNVNNIKFEYRTGSIENSSAKNNEISTILAKQGIRQHVCDILEGGYEAFNKREKKYGFC